LHQQTIAADLFMDTASQCPAFLSKIGRGIDLLAGKFRILMKMSADGDDIIENTLRGRFQLFCGYVHRFSSSHRSLAWFLPPALNPTFV
jgi:predicted butyrate kinase (DUF1464 family)